MSPSPRSRRPLTLGVVALLALALVVWLLVSGSGSQSATSGPTSIATNVPPSVSSHTPSTTSLPPQPPVHLPAQSSYPAYQHIPYFGDGIQVSLTGVTPDGHFELNVFSQVLSVPQERAVFAAFLQRYHDPGTKYVVTYTSSTSPALAK